LTPTMGESARADPSAGELGMETGADTLHPIARGRKERASREGEIKLARPTPHAAPARRGTSDDLGSVPEGEMLQAAELQVVGKSSLDDRDAAPVHSETPGFRKPTAGTDEDPLNASHPIAKGRKERASRDDEKPRVSRPPPK